MSRKGCLTRLAGLALFAALIAVPGLIIAGLAVMFGSPCFFKQFPPDYCNASNDGPPGLGVLLLVLGVALLALLIVVVITAGLTAKSAKRRGPRP